MHRQTVEAYEAGADHWLQSRRGPGAGEADRQGAASFRAAVGPGLILDLGCGPGQLLASIGPPAIGLDASHSMLALAARDLGPLVHADLEALPFRDGCAAGAFANFSLQHLPCEGFARALADVRRALHAGGLLELTVHTGEHADGVRDQDDMPLGRWFTYWREPDARSAIEASGFDVLRVEDFGRAALRIRARRARP